MTIELVFDESGCTARPTTAARETIACTVKESDRYNAAHANSVDLRGYQFPSLK